MSFTSDYVYTKDILSIPTGVIYLTHLAKIITHPYFKRIQVAGYIALFGAILLQAKNPYAILIPAFTIAILKLTALLHLLLKGWQTLKHNLKHIHD